MKEMKTLTINGVTYTVADPDAAHIDDGAVSADTAWSGAKVSAEMDKRISSGISAAELALVDKLCPGFVESGAVVCCQPVEGYPLGVVSRIELVQEGEGDPSPGSWVDVSEEVYLWSVDEVTIDCQMETGTTYKVIATMPTSDGYINSVYVGTSPTEEIEITSVAFDENDGERIATFVFTTPNVLPETVQIRFFTDNAIMPTYSIYQMIPGNIRPITGHTAVKLWRGGKNLIPYPYPTPSKTINGIDFTSNEDGSVTINGTSSATVFFNLIQHGGIWLGNDLIRTSANGTVIKNGYAFSIGVENSNVTLFYEPSGVVYLKIEKGITIENITVYPQIEYGTTVNPYEPYRGQTFTAQLGQTVYGGSLDWKTGVLTVDTYNITIDGTESVKQNTIGGYPRFDITPGIAIPVQSSYQRDQLCSHFMLNSGAAIVGNTRDLSFASFKGKIYIRYDAMVEVAAFKAFLAQQYAAGTPVQVCYQLAKPITIQLTPTEVLALSGQNTLYSDTGDTAVTGRVDPQTIIADQQATIKSVLERVTALEAAAVNNI